MRRPRRKQSIGVKSSPQETPMLTILSCDPPGGEKTQTDPGRARHCGEANGKVSRRPPRNHEPKGKEKRRAEGGGPLEADRGIARRHAQGSNPARARSSVRDCGPRRSRRPEIRPGRSLAWVGIRDFNPRAATQRRPIMFPETGKASRRARREAAALRKPPSGQVEGKDLERPRSEWVSRHGAKHKSEREPRAIDGTKNEGGRDRPPSNRVDSREARGVRRSALRSGRRGRSRVHLVHMVG